MLSVQRYLQNKFVVSNIGFILIFLIGFSFRHYNIPFVVNCSYFLSVWMTLVVIVVMYVVLSRLVVNTLDAVAFGTLYGGAFSNWVERAVYTCVRDYFRFFDLFNFNLSDIAISAGASILLIRVVTRHSLSRKS